MPPKAAFNPWWGRSVWISKYLVSAPPNWNNVEACCIQWWQAWSCTLDGLPSLFLSYLPRPLPVFPECASQISYLHKIVSIPGSASWKPQTKIQHIVPIATKCSELIRYWSWKATHSPITTQAWPAWTSCGNTGDPDRLTPRSHKQFMAESRVPGSPGFYTVRLNLVNHLGHFLVKTLL